MDKKLEFNDALTSLIEFASVNDNTVTPDDVKLFFNEIITDESNYTHIYDYLISNKITVTGIQNNDRCNNNVNETTEEHNAFVKMYLDELSDIIPLKQDELKSVIDDAVNGNSDAKERLIESHLHLVVDIARQYSNKGVLIGDLIQEGNIGLMMAVNSYESGDFTDYITGKITKSIVSAIDLQLNSDRINKHLLERVNALDKASRELSENLGREPKIDEICEYMNLSEEEVQNIMKISLDALNVTDGNTMPETSYEQVAKEPRRSRRGPKLK